MSLSTEPTWDFHLRQLSQMTNETLTPTILSDSADSAPNYFTTNQAPFIVIIIFACLSLVSFICSCSGPDDPDSNEGNGESPQESAPLTPAQALAKEIKEMTTEERTTFYNKAFSKNKHHTVLKESAIIVGRKGDNDINTTRTMDTEEENSLESNGGGFDDDDDPSIYLALKEVREKRRSTLIRSSITSSAVEVALGDENTINEDGSRKQQRRRTTILHPRLSTASAKVDLEHGYTDTKSNGIVRGNCVICFEDMTAGEDVVWSENKSCQHVYHRHCMVSYLAHKKQTLKELEMDENPCPTCRRKFLSVCTLAK